MRRPTVLGLAFAAAVVVASAAYAAYAGTTVNPTSTITAAPDWTAPTSSASTIARNAGCTPTTPGYIKQGGTYYVYAAVTDTGNPASGVSTVTANDSTITTGQTAVALAAGSYSVGGTSYTHRTAAQTANAVLAAGSKTYSLAMADAAANNGSQTGLSVTVDNTAPAASDIQLTNKAGGTVGQPESGDLATFTFSELPEPCSLLANWDGTSTMVTARITKNGSNDTLTIWDSANTTQLSFGSVATGSNCVQSTSTFTSTMVLSGNTVTITLGTQTSGTVRTDGGNAVSVWSPSTAAYDRAQNAMSATTVNETGTNDPNF
jgi:hypothetical protein